MTIRDYAKKWGRDENNNFAAACCENSIEELQKPHSPADADDADCAVWGISPEEWSAAIDAALKNKIDEIEKIDTKGETLKEIEKKYGLINAAKYALPDGKTLEFFNRTKGKTLKEIEKKYGLIKIGGKISSDGGKTFLPPYSEMPPKMFEELLFDVESWMGNDLSTLEIDSLKELLDHKG